MKKLCVLSHSELSFEKPEKHLKYLLSAAVILAKNGEEDIFITD